MAADGASSTKSSRWKLESGRIREKLQISPSYSPWTSRASFEGRGFSHTPRVLDLLNVVTAEYLSKDVAKRSVEKVMSGVILDISQSHSRKAHSSRYGVCPCLTTSSLLYSSDDDSVLDAREHMLMQGHPKSMVIPLSMLTKSSRNLRTLAGEGMALPCLGVCLAALLILKPIPAASDS